MRKTFVLLLLALGFYSGPARALDVDDPPQGTFADDWFAIMLDGNKSGHMHSSMQRIKSKDGGDLIRSKTEILLTAGRGDANITITLTQQSDETLAGEPRSFSHITKMGMIPSTTRGEIKDGKVSVTTSQFGQKSQTETHDLPEGAMMTWAIYREQIKRGLKPGTRYSLPLYEPSMSVDQITPATIEIGEKETLDLFGRKVEAIKTTQSLQLKGSLGAGGDIETTTWMKEDGSPVRLQMQMMNIPIEIITCAKSIALARNNPSDIMGSTLIPVTTQPDKSAAQMTYRLRWKPATNKKKIIEIPETGMQKVRSNSPTEQLVVVTRGSARDKAKNETSLTPEDRQRHLAASPVLNHKDPSVHELAQKAAEDEKNPRRLAEKLCNFVSEYIESKNLSVGFATASEVARSKEGDCTEHAVLLAALGRAVELPSRVVAGLVYADTFTAKKQVFVGHMWTQFWLDGQWVDFDAALGQTNPDPTHIALSLSPASDTGIADLVGSLWLTMSNLSIDVMKSE